MSSTKAQRAKAKPRQHDAFYRVNYVGRGYEVRMLAERARETLRSFRVHDSERLVAEMMRGKSVTVGTSNGLVIISRIEE